jgi:hypothetical protein
MNRIIETGEPTVGLVISTFAALPYVHLHLESRRRNYPQVPVLVHDDGSPDGAALGDLCRRYEVEFTTTARRHGHFVGDLAALLGGFDWAGARGLDLLVKFSRRFIPTYDWVPEFQTLAYVTQYATYSSRCLASGYGFRTECVGMHVKSWCERGAVEKLRALVGRDEKGVFVEKFVHDLGREVHEHNCEYNREYERFAARPPNVAAYGEWLLAGISRHIPRPRVLWHNYSPPGEYAAQARQYGLTQYGDEDFSDPNRGLGDGRFD